MPRKIQRMGYKFMDEKERNWCLHKATQQWFENAGEQGPWITVYKSTNKQLEDKEDREDPFIWSFLIKLESIGDELSNYGFNQFDGYPCTEKYENNDTITYYSRYGYDDREPLFFRRRFNRKDSYLELSQEFIHFFQLYYDQSAEKYLLLNPDGNDEVVVEIKDRNEIRISLRHLKQYLAFKNMALILGVVIQHFFDEPIGEGFEPTNRKEVSITKMDTLHYAIWYQDGFGGWNFFTEFIGKKVIFPMPIEKTGIYPFEPEREFENFIIGQDPHGNPVYYSCNPNGLSNYFGKNPGKPHYLTSVFFDKKVLAKYYSQPGIYLVEDGQIQIGDYTLRADTNHSEFAIVFLGDLGKDIPFSEQRYWKLFNVIPSGEMSRTEYQRSLLGNFAEPEAEQFILRNRYNDLQESWERNFGWPLFKPLNKGDLYRFDNLRVPLSENQQEFDQQVESLVILIIDSINKAQIDKLLNITDTKIRHIQSLELFCKSNNLIGYEEPITFLHDLYKLRSQGASHRKDSKDYPKIHNSFGIDKNGYIQTFRGILKTTIALLEFFISFSENSAL
jgi:hypothetical protein